MVTMQSYYLTCKLTNYYKAFTPACVTSPGLHIAHDRNTKIQRLNQHKLYISRSSAIVFLRNNILKKYRKYR